MCGRYFLYYDKEFIIDAFQIVNEFDYEEDRFNIAPSQDVLAVVKSSTGNRAGYMKWGLIPKWADDSKIGNKLINTRSETIEEKPSFKESFYQKRCLIPASGFYEWVKQGSKKQPYQFTLEGNEPFAFAGIWSRWNKGTVGRSDEIISCSIITKESNSFMGNYHHRMPVMLRPEEGELWLERETKKDLLLMMLHENNPELAATPVTRDLNTR
ncbi:SOS response-associated peptidase [Fictibacillus phosphorivorans]|uniref:SOS response-associated peptidase n=1 Tax=Fictibacillus phosphorivorans TaxID=1221500 RepID=UPI00203A5761|nr:SOS response-associated peptidase [Fictibacillus phosphorivorans]MCM3718578.1 SOS response-associated peptidase [Fictibacillus phosphorivorans]MCM3776201.1 SOS response-associated peptidase [Fictibacillus phosphorivorans]